MHVKTCDILSGEVCTKALSKIQYGNKGIVHDGWGVPYCFLKGKRYEFMKVKKWLLGLVTFAAMAVLCVVCAGAETYGDFEYEVSYAGVRITEYNGSAEKVDIPAEIDGKSVTSIGGCTFYYCTYLTSITIPNSVMYIENQAFEGCTRLKSITIPDSVTEIEYSAFSACTSLTEIKVATKNANYVSVNGVLYNKDKTTIMCYPAGKKDKNYKIIDSVTEIDRSAFEDCTSLTSITMPDGVTVIGYSAFSGCTSLTSITIPNSVTSIGGNAFSNTALLENQTTSEKYVGKWVIDCDDDAKSVTIKNGTVGIAGGAFGGCESLTSVTIPSSVTSIGDSAFGGCESLTSVTIPSSVTSIGEYAFDGCTSLTSITIPNSVTSISDSAFLYCSSLKSITIPNSVTSIGDDAFRGCVSLKSITIPNSITEIGWEAFMGCTSLKSVTIPTSVKSIESVAFGYIDECEKVDDFKINYVKYTEGHRYAAENGFADEIYFETRELDNGSLCISDYLGELSSSSITIPTAINGKQVTEIDGWAFEGCTSLTSVTIPDSITKIGEAAFKGSGLTTVKLPEKLTDIGIGAFAYTPIINNQKTDIKYIGSTIVSCDTEAETLTIGDDVTAIASNAFADGDIYASKCYKLKSITIPRSVKYIGEHAFGYYLGMQMSFVYEKNNDFGIKCYSNSAAEQYAKDNEIDYELLDKSVLTKVTGVKLTGRAADALRINWTKNTSADGYIVEMYQNGKWVRVAKITSNNTTTFRKAGLKAGTAYKFRVKAYKMSGKTAVYSDYSTIVAARTNPSVIKGAKLGGRAADALRINWTKNASADGYIVEMYQGGKWVRAAKITKNSTTTFRKAGLKASTVYKFRVRAYKMSGKTALYGNYSATVTARTNPSIVKGVKIGGKAKDALRVNWTKNASAQGYIVEMCNGGKWVRVAKITNSNTTTFRKAGLAKNTAYKFRVRAYHMSGKTALYGNYGSVSGKTAAK